jgi:nitroimidazol reductase NimA-like FMN-containing flavoprotein (pyridoxamine 5'-phosphate oxidase superfamily)
VAEDGGVRFDRNGLEILDREECLHLLATATLGRIGISSGALPMVLPVNFLLDGETILIRTGDGTKLDAATQNAVVAFEVDDLDSMYHSGWSVVVTGMAREVTEPGELSEIALKPLARWAHQGDGRVIAISTDVISGRRIAPGRPRPDELG